ncbi:MAG: SDR family oxidoreductase [Desulfomonilia bacterium]|nr:SDR family oxidoreductase [Deltaproteobacteria bacterium]MDI9541979.1 SDR family oxidoreductase [Pseudomonadota bacterium]
MNGHPGDEKKAAVVSGGARGIGRAIACRLLEDGYSVLIFDIDRKTGMKTVSELQSEGDAAFCHVDVGDEESVKAAFEQLPGRGYSHIDFVVNNAGISDPHGDPIGKIDIAMWNRILAVNLTSVVLTAKHAYPLFRRGRGAIVNISSTRFLQSEKNTFAYTASKGGMVSLTHALAVSLGPNIRANCISPGWIHTHDEPLSSEDHAQHPAGRVGEPRDIASLVSWLLSDESRFVTGQNFIVDGGMTRKMIYVE